MVAINYSIILAFLSIYYPIIQNDEGKILSIILILVARMPCKNYTISTTDPSLVDYCRLGRGSHLRVVFSFIGKGMRTIVYIDGFNFYYGRLKITSYKWLDLFKLFDEQLIGTIAPESELLTVKFFTADIKAKFSRLGKTSETAQKIYHNALLAYTGNVEIIKGYYSVERSKPLRYKTPPDKSDTVEAWKLEEKQTDVNMALSLYHDVVTNSCDQVVICTNDTDLVPALKLIKEHHEHIKIGSIIPRPKLSSRPASQSIVDLSDWSRRYITDSELAVCQLPDTVLKPNGRGVYRKPDHWNASLEESFPTIDN